MMTPHAPVTLEEQIVGQQELSEHCATEAVIPPPDSCPQSVHAAYGFAQAHVITWFVIVMALVMLIGAIGAAFAKGGHH